MIIFMNILFVYVYLFLCFYGHLNGVYAEAFAPDLAKCGLMYF
jgi:hypothetical protein